MSALLKSRKFLLLCMDTIVTLVLFFVGKYAGIALEDVRMVITAIQPVFIVIIGAIAYEDGQALAYGVHPSSSTPLEKK